MTDINRHIAEVDREMLDNGEKEARGGRRLGMRVEMEEQEETSLPLRKKQHNHRQRWPTLPSSNPNPRIRMPCED